MFKLIVLLVIWDEVIGVIVTAPHFKEPAEVVQGSDQDATWSDACFSGMSCW